MDDILTVQKKSQAERYAVTLHWSKMKTNLSLPGESSLYDTKAVQYGCKVDLLYTLNIMSTIHYPNEYYIKHCPEAYSDDL